MEQAHLRRAVFLDRDGTLIEEKNYLSRPDQVRLLPGSAEAVRQLRHAGWACVVISNQSGIGRGLFTEADLASVHADMSRQLAEAGTSLDGIYHCPVAPGTSDRTVVEHSDRKPGPGMLLRAARELDLILAQSWMVGDNVVDVLAGRNAGCRGTILVRSGHDIADALPHLGEYDLVAEDLAEAARWILSDTAAKPAGESSSPRG
ncbi:MAG: HAD family hydrolase [Planctomycetes bacterium]|nr:HAD family hydrolase [Planctomycetota bacterium]